MKKSMRISRSCLALLVAGLLSFPLSGVAQTESVLHSFLDGSVASDGVNPQGGVFQGSDGNLYGITPTGGTSNRGVFYQVSPKTGAAVVLHSFGAGADGYFDSSSGIIQSPGLALGADGFFYSTTPLGGTAGQGTVYKLNPVTKAYNILHHFGDGTVLRDGSSPEGGLILGVDGNYYGTTTLGGKSARGTVSRSRPPGRNRY